MRHHDTWPRAVPRRGVGLRYAPALLLFAAQVGAVEPTLTFPMSNDVLRPGGVLRITGSAGAPYKLHFGAGYHPTQWSSDGIKLTGEPEGVLATWDTSGITRNDFYTLRLTVTAPGGESQQTYAHMIYFETRLKPGWPQHIGMNNQYTLGENHVQPLVADLDKDGRQEVIVGDFPAPPSDGKTARVLVYGTDGTLRWSADLEVAPGQAGTMVSGNIDADPFLEVVVVAANRVFAFNHDGTPCPGAWPVPIFIATTANLADLNDDGASEVVVRSENTIWQHGEYRNFLYVLDGLGAVVSTAYPDFCPNGFTGFGLHSSAVGNFDADPDLEVATKFGCGGVAAYNRDGSMVEGWPQKTQGIVVGSLSAGDLDGDGIDEVLVPASAWPQFGYPKGGVFAFGAGGLVPGWPVHTNQDFFLAPALGDVDGDGYLDISFTASRSNVLHVVDRSGSELPGWPQTIQSFLLFHYLSSNDLADVDGDGRLDVVAVSGGIHDRFISGGDFSKLGGVAAWRADGTRIDLAPSYPGSQDLLADFWPLGATPIVADLEGDGKVDLVWGTGASYGYCPGWDTGCRLTAKRRHNVYVWALKAKYDARPGQWPMFQADSQHTGRQTP